ncbi:hypothetical protein CCL17_23905 [Pseudomonas congelans]|uniref:hypothetical protein n=1 Tax=Pseudomonas congelans TaxID=200452 RepID=UPI000BB5C5DC|nr:hypothetical protein [Pseudomonas congelans]PBP95315.1 hypothetical protein CCL17_23905 [Pseudomonas congelans]
MLEWITSINGATPAFFLSVVTAACGLYHYITIKKSEEAARRFTTYHKMIQDLNIGEDGEAQYIDRQMVIVFEMRNFPEYFPASLRLLERSLPKWKVFAMMNSNPLSPSLLAEEATLTINFIKRRMDERSYLCIAEEDRF